MLIVVYACALMGYKNPTNTKAARRRIAMAASNLVCYDLCYNKIRGKTMMERWIKELEQSARVQGHRIGLKSKHKGKVGGTFVARVNEQDPTYLLTLYWYAIEVNGNNATFWQLASAMNAKAAVDQVLAEFHTSEGHV